MSQFSDAAEKYDREGEQVFRDRVADELGKRHHREEDIEITSISRLVFTDETTGTRYRLRVDGGALDLEAV